MSCRVADCNNRSGGLRHVAILKRTEKEAGLDRLKQHQAQMRAAAE
jgi:hypothetical protein